MQEEINRIAVQKGGGPQCRVNATVQLGGTSQCPGFRPSGGGTPQGTTRGTWSRVRVTGINKRVFPPGSFAAHKRPLTLAQNTSVSIAPGARTQRSSHDITTVLRLLYVTLERTFPLYLSLLVASLIRGRPCVPLSLSIRRGHKGAAGSPSEICI